MSGEEPEPRAVGGAGPGNGFPAPLTQEHVNQLAAGRTPPEVASLLGNHPGFVKAEGGIEARARKPAPFTQAQVEAQLAGQLKVEEIAAILDRLGVPSLGDLGLPSLGNILPGGPQKRAPIELSDKELLEAARGATPEAVAQRLPTQVGGEDLPLPDPPLGRPTAMPPIPGIDIAADAGA